MILSHRHRFLFLKTSKTAGTSLEIGLSKFCGPRDVITPNAPEDEALRRRLGGRRPQNFRRPWSDLSAQEWWRTLITRGRPRRYYHHIPASQVRPLVGEEVWKTYFKFCFERNPFDRVISQYYWRHQEEARPSFSEYLRSDLPDFLRERGMGIYTIDGEVVVDKVYRFEEIDDALRELETLLRLPSRIELPRAKSRTRRDRRDPSEVLSAADRRLVAEKFAWEIERFGYE